MNDQAADARPATVMSKDGDGPSASSAENALSTHGVTVRFAALVAVENVDLSVQPSQILGLIGPNGAGKTTLVNAITGFERPTSGSVNLGDRAITDLPPHKRARLGIVRTFQSGHSFGRLTAFENVEVAAIGTRTSRRDARRR